MRGWWTLGLLLTACGGDRKDTATDGVTADVCADSPGESFCDGSTAVTCDASGGVASTESCDPATETCSAGACISCQPIVEVPWADAAVVASRGLFVEIDQGPVEGRSSRVRPVVISGRAQVTLDGPFEGFLDDGAPLPSEVTDRTIWVRASAAGAGSLTVAPVGCSGESTVIALEGGVGAPIAGRSLDGFPWFEAPAVVNFDDTVEALVDPYRFFDRAGLPFDAWIVPHREPAEWAADPALAPIAVAGPTPGVVPTVDLQGAAVAVADDLPVDGLLAGYDLVVDFGGDGRLDPGDLLDGLDAPGFFAGADLSEPGPYTPMHAEQSLSYWLTHRVYWPAEVDQLDPVPLVVISHGNGHEYDWYDYLGNHLASHGYVVMSHRNNTGPGVITAAVTTWQNTDAFLGSLPDFQGGVLDGEVDGSRIVWIGHSRGGEGVVIAYDALVDGDISPQNYGPSDVVLVSSIAPTLFEGPDVANPNAVTYHQLDGSADGDVTGGVDIDLVQYFRIFQRGTGLHAVTYVQGATHNDFNCCGFNDGAFVGPGPKIGRTRAQQLARSYLLALLEAELNGQDQLWEYFARPPERFRPPGVDVVVSTQLHRAQGDRKRVIDDFQSAPDLAEASSGATIDGTVEARVEGPLDDGNLQLAWNASDPMNGMSQSHGDPSPARGVVFEWASGADEVLEYDLAADQRDWTGDSWLSFRACQGTRHPNTVALQNMLSFSVELEDGAGRTSTIDHRVYGGIPTPYRRDGLGAGVGWVNEFQTIRLPLSGFVAEGRTLDLSDVRTVRFRFGAAHGSPQGRIGLDDLELLQEDAP